MIQCSTCKYYSAHTPSPDNWRKPHGVCNYKLPPWVEHQLHDESFDRSVSATDICHFYEERKVEV